MGSFIVSHRRPLTVILALAGIGVTVAYVFCLGACSYLTGSMVGLDLKYLGIAYMATVLVLALLRQSFLCLLLLAFGAGGELFLIGYQIRADVYCPFCLAFGATVILALIVNFEPAKKWLAALAAAAGLGFFLMFFSGSTTPPPPAPKQAVESPLHTFGIGPVEMRIYTDYFCGPCRAEEAEVMALVTDLINRNRVRVLFIDVPVHQETPLYAGYFLAALEAIEKPDIRRAVEVRAALFQAAAQKIEAQKTEDKKADLQKGGGKKADASAAEAQKAKEREVIERLFKDRKIPFQTFDPKPVFNVYSRYLNEDRINATPTIVVIRPEGRLKLTGKEEVLKGLHELSLGIPPAATKTP
jgi:hypothetical protein